jgi:HSP20 family molecular chaperone IbpA
MDDDAWEDDLLDKLEQAMRSMGMPITRDQLRPFLRMIKDQLDNSGIDLNKIAGMPNLNLDLDNLFKSLSSGESIEDVLKNLGVAVQVDMAPVDLDESALETDDEETISLPSDDVYLDGWNMAITLDFALKGDIPSEQLEIELVKEGSQVEIMRSTQPKPLALVALPHPCEDVVEWTLNNGVLDITLKLTPQGKALEMENDDVPATGDVHIDVANSDDDDEDDGGIPIF